MGRYFSNDYKRFLECKKSILVFILGRVITDTMKFAFLFFEFYIPYVVCVSELSLADPIMLQKYVVMMKIPILKINDLMFSVWSESVIIHEVKIKMSVLR